MNGNAASSSACPLRARARRAQIGRGQRLGVPGHGAALARHVEADGELAPPGQPRRESRPRRSTPIRPGAIVTAALPPNRTARLVPATTRAAAQCSPAKTPSKSHRPGAERIREAQARLACPTGRVARSGGTSGRARRSRARETRSAGRVAPTDSRRDTAPAPRRPTWSPTSAPAAGKHANASINPPIRKRGIRAS